MKKALMMAVAAGALMSMPALANEWSQEKADAKFSELDTNKDGKVSKAEHEAHKEGMFDEADTNKDGDLSKEEFSAEVKKKWEATKDKAHELKEKAADKAHEVKEDVKH